MLAGRGAHLSPSWRQASPRPHGVWPVGISPGCHVSFPAQTLALDASPPPRASICWVCLLGIHFLSLWPEHQALRVFPQ